MVSNPESIEAQRMHSPETAESRKETRKENFTSVETVESLDRKIADIDDRASGYADSIEETNARLVAARAELGLPPMEAEPPSIAQSREAEMRLEAQKKQLIAQKEQLVGGAEATEKRDGFKEIIPRGWTILKHGTNLMNWGDTNPYTSDRITLEKPLSVISQEEFERDSKDGTRYDTTENYSSTSRPEGMSQEEFEAKNKPFEIRVAFLKNHAQDLSDPEYRDTLDKPTLERIAKYYYANIQRGRHPLVPKGEVLVKLGRTQENGKDVFHFVPESIAEAYAKEAGIVLPAKAEASSETQFAAKVEGSEKPRLLEDDPRYKEFLTHETYDEAFGGSSSAAEHAAYARELFRKQFPEDAKVYEAGETTRKLEDYRIEREADRKEREAAARAQKEIKEAALMAEAEKRDKVEQVSFDRSIDDFVGGGVVPNELGEQLKARRRSGTLEERRVFDEAVGQASYDFRIKRGSPEGLIRALTSLTEARADASRGEASSSSEQSSQATPRVESVPVDRASVADQQNVARGLENLWVNSGLSNNGLVRLRERIATGSAEEVRILNAEVMKATRTFARTRDAEALAHTLMRLSV